MSRTTRNSSRRTESPASIGTRSPTSQCRKVLDRINANFLNAELGEETSPVSAGVCHVLPEPMVAIVTAAAEKLQTALGQTSYADDFASFIPPLRMKAMKTHSDGHPKFQSGANLKKIDELSLEKFLKLMRFGTEAADLSSAQKQILRAFHGKNLTFENYNEIEAVCLRILQITEMYALPKEAQKNVTHHQAVDERTSQEPHIPRRSSTMANDGALKILEGLTEEILMQLCDNKTMFAAWIKESFARAYPRNGSSWKVLTRHKKTKC